MITAQQLHGVTIATVLPFFENGDIDWTSYDRLLDYCIIGRSLASVFVNGHAGEVAALTPEERMQVIRHTRQRVGDALPIMAGIVAYSTAEAVERAKEAEAAGADVAVLFPFPQYGAGGGSHPTAAVEYANAVLDACKLPISVFQYPIKSGAGFSTSVLQALAKLPRMLAIKEGSGEINVYEDNLHAIKSVVPDVAMLPSNYGWLMAQLAVGGDGILSGMGSLMPQMLLDLWQASQRNDLPAMRAANQQIYPLERAIYGAPPGMDMHTRIKVALQHLGVIACAKPRAPLPSIGAEIAQQVCSAVDASNLRAGVKATLA
jgi:4-hydroxy-tetrahydrodipicolinate synthase